MAPEETIPIVQAVVRDSIELELMQEGVVQVVAGVPFRVAYAYRIHEASRMEDAWRFCMTACIQGEAEALSQIVVRDRRLVKDDVWSHMSQEHLCPEPGDYILAFDAEAELTRRRWAKQSEPHSVARESIHGELRVHAIAQPGASGGRPRRTANPNEAIA